MSVQQFRDELKTALEAMGGLNVYKEWSSVIVPPYAVIYLSPDNPITYHQPAKGNITYHFNVEIGVLKAATIEAAQEALEPYLEPTGTTSVYYTLVNTAYTYVDVVDVSDVVNYGEVVYGGSQYYGARLKLDAWKSGL